VHGIPEKSDAWLLAGVLGVLLGAMAWLCLSVTILPLGDYPNHLARLFIQTHVATDQYLSQYYRLYWHWQPNLALEAIAWVLSPFLNVYIVGRLLGVATFASLAIGMVALHRALHGRFSPAALLPSVLIVNRFYVWGSLGYMLALGAAFGAMAAWIACREKPLVQFVLGTVLATAVYLGHLYAFGVYAICSVGYELYRLLQRPDRRRALVRSAAVLTQLLPAGLLLVFFSPTTQTHQAPQWQDIWAKVLGPVVLLPGYDLLLEAALLAACVACPLIAWFIGAGRIRWDFSFAILAFAVLYAVLPHQMFSGYDADRRLLVPLAMLIMISFDWTAVTIRARAAQWALVGLTSFIQFGNIAVHWRSYERDYAELLRLTSMVEPGGRVFGIMVNATNQYLTYPPLQEVVSLAAIERSALVSGLFVYPISASSPLKYQPPYEALAPRSNIIYATRKGAAQSEFDATRSRMESVGIDYLLLIDSRRFALDVPDTYQLVGATHDARGRLFHIR
jgi:hypothetical protein